MDSKKGKMDTYEQAALNWANDRRKSQGQKPLDKLPKGKKGSKLYCPLAIATGHEMSYVTPGPYDLYVRRFMINFDDGKYKHLIKRWWRRDP